eukprot:TRINITY_DN48396_c0_g1_i1.p1 TRINITY_DN48396_c0_g1~~TRINITY_DN48396_c0_g1_i1.p1  ORF type:complete len:87 (+),score=5.55 TRINITY_DN48396_c0_g1_i1:129-389(+)
MQSEVFQDAVTYVKTVKLSLGPNGYAHFLQLLQSLHLDRSNRVEVLSRINKLFVGKEHLMTGFSQFVPQEWNEAPIEVSQQIPLRT